jgi:hypothetical protein
VIPSFKFDYFDKITQSKKSIATKPISIQIKSKKGGQKPIKKLIKSRQTLMIMRQLTI